MLPFDVSVADITVGPWWLLSCVRDNLLAVLAVSLPVFGVGDEFDEGDELDV